VTLSVTDLASILESIPELVGSSGSGKRPEAFRCVSVAQDGISEGGRNNAMFQLAVMCRRFGLNDENVYEVVGKASSLCEPPLDAFEVTQLLRSSERSGPICNQLGENLSCGDACILRNKPGLNPRVGALLHAAEGEPIVLTAGERLGKVLAVEHPDIKQGSVTLTREV
jgi:hypothetical protein